MSKSEKDTSRDDLIFSTWLTLESLLSVFGKKTGKLIDELQLPKLLESIFSDKKSAENPAGLVKTLIAHDEYLSTSGQFISGQELAELLEYQDVQEYLLVNTHDGIIYYNRERFEELVRWMFMINRVDQLLSGSKTSKNAINKFDEGLSIVKRLHQISIKASFEINKLKQLLVEQSAIKI